MTKNKSLSIIRYPDAALRKKAEAILKIDQDIFELSEQMIALMAELDGVGLAATQVGEPHRLFILNTTPFEDKANPIVVVNPEIVDCEGLTTDEEGCLSFPKLYLQIARAKKVRLCMQNLFNERSVIEVEDFLARAVLHEIDHLNGVLFIDHASAADRDKVDGYLGDLKVAAAR